MKLNYNSFLFFCLVITLFLNRTNEVYSQNQIDSLSYYFELSSDKTKGFRQRLDYVDKAIAFSRKKNNVDVLLKGLNRKSYLYFKLGDYTKAVITAKELLEESTKANDTSRILLSFGKLADYNRYNDSVFKAYKYYQEHKILSLKVKDSLSAIRDLRFIASIQNKLGLLNESEVSVVEAISLLDGLKQDKTTLEPRTGLYNHLGIIYKELGNYDRALEMYNKLLKLTKDTLHVNIIHNNIANVYKAQKNYELAYSEFKKVYQAGLKLNDTFQTARALNNLGFVKAKLNYEDALTDINLALTLRKQKNNLYELFSSYITLSEYYRDINDFKQLRYYANKAYAVSVINKNSIDRLTALSYLVEIEAQKNIAEYKWLTDSISKVKQENENKFTFIKYNYLQKEKEAREIELKFKDSQLKVEKEKSNKTIYQSIAIIGLLITIFLYFIIKNKHKKEKLEQVYNTETRISKKLHDEVANDLYHVMTKLQSKDIKEETVLDDLESIYSKTRDISKETSLIEFNQDFKETLEDLLLAFQTDDLSIVTKGLNNINWDTISDLKKTAIYRVIQELMTNMKKHSKASVTVVKFQKSNKKLEINYNDNGIGSKLKKHNGLQNAENRIVSLNGTITFESDINKGFKVKITI